MRRDHLSKTEYYIPPESVNSKFTPFFIVFKWFFFLFLLSAIFGLFYSDSGIDISLESLLIKISNAPNLDFTWVNQLTVMDLPDWSFSIGSFDISFNWLKSPIEFILTFYRPFFLLATGVAQIVAFAFYFITTFFGG